MNVKLMGVLGMLGGAGLMAVEARHLISRTPLSGATIDRLDEAGYLLWGIGGACACWAMYRLGVTGNGRVTRLVPVVAGIGFAVLAVGSAMDMLGMATAATNPVFFIAWPLFLIGGLLSGIFALVARTWGGWRKFAPIICVLAFPALFALSALTGGTSDLLLGLSWVVLGFAVFSSDEPAATRSAVPA